MVKLRMAHQNSYKWSLTTWIPVVILELIHAPKFGSAEELCLLGKEPIQALSGPLVMHSNRTNRMASADDGPFKFPEQLVG